MLRYSSAANEAETKAESAAAEHVSAMLAKERELSATQLALNKAHSDVAAAEKAKADAEGEAAATLAAAAASTPAALKQQVEDSLAAVAAAEQRAAGEWDKPTRFVCFVCC